VVAIHTSLSFSCKNNGLALIVHVVLALRASQKKCFHFLFFSCFTFCASSSSAAASSKSFGSSESSDSEAEKSLIFMNKNYPKIKRLINIKTP